jgi:hypothetical protein
VAAQVREVAEKAQVDLGLDYAWLDEVTYSDWQRYHSLIDGGFHPSVLPHKGARLMLIFFSFNPQSQREIYSRDPLDAKWHARVIVCG